MAERTVEERYGREKEVEVDERGITMSARPFLHYLCSSKTKRTQNHHRITTAAGTHPDLLIIKHLCVCEGLQRIEINLINGRVYMDQS